MSSLSVSPPFILPMATSLSEVHQCHAHMVKNGLLRSTFDAARLLYAAVTVSSDGGYPRSIFARIPEPNSFAWNAMIRAHVESQEPERGLDLFLTMLCSTVLPDRFTFPIVLKACAALLALEEARQIHSRIVKSGFTSDMFVQNTLLHAYGTMCCEKEACELFDRMPDRDVVSWNALISSFVSRGQMDDARNLFNEMTERNTETWNFMVSGYAKVGLLDDARELFDRMPVKDVISWNAMITGYTRGGYLADAIELFRDMQLSDIKPDACTLVNVLSACARVGAVSQGEWVHAYMERNGVEVKGFLCTALVDMHSKCGSIDKALRVFSDASKKDISSWNSMIAGLSSHGRAERALSLFEEMLESGVQPNEVTYVNVLAACSHAGLLDEGMRIFNEMVGVHKIEPTVVHYGCLVDLLARAGELRKAVDIADTLLIEEDPALWESLLSACRSHGDIELAERVANRLAGLSPGSASLYVQLSNVYASFGRWDDVGEVRSTMRERKVVKEPGCSTIEVEGLIHEFFAGEMHHHRYA